MALTKTSIVNSLVLMTSLALNAREILFECQINAIASQTLLLAFERDDAWAQAWDVPNTASQDAPSFITDAELLFSGIDITASLEVTFEPGFAQNYAFLNLSVPLDKEILSLSLMEDPILGTAWGHGVIGPKALTLNCCRVFEESNGSSED